MYENLYKEEDTQWLTLFSLPLVLEGGIYWRWVIRQRMGLAMPTAEQVKALLKSYPEGDGNHFLSIALQIAAHAARSGKGQLAQELRGLVDDIKRKQSTN